MASTLSNARKEYERAALACERIASHLNLVLHYYQGRFPEYSEQVGIAIGTVKELGSYIDFLDNALTDLGREETHGYPVEQDNIGGGIERNPSSPSTDTQQEASNQRSIEHS
jgi:hypothetical protein